MNSIHATYASFLFNYIQPHPVSSSSESRKTLSDHWISLLMWSLVISRLDCGNSHLTGLSVYAFSPLQSIQNGAACLVCNKLKTRFFIFHTLKGTEPYWLCTMVQNYIPPCQLRMLGMFFSKVKSYSKCNNLLLRCSGSSMVEWFIYFFNIYTTYTTLTLDTNKAFVSCLSCC